MGNIGQYRAIAGFDWIVLARSDDIRQKPSPDCAPLPARHHLYPLSARTMPGPRSPN